MIGDKGTSELRRAEERYAPANNEQISVPPVILANNTSFFIPLYTKSNWEGASGEPVLWIWRRVEREWCAMGR